MKNLLSNSDIKSAERDEKPIGLKLTKTQSLLKKLNKLSHQPVDDRDRKAINFPVSCLQIGEWKVRSLHEGDLTVKCYFKKCKLVWEFLDPAWERKLKKKIEIDWLNITAIKAKAGILDIKLENPPKFFGEINPEPRKHTNWEETEDFTHNCQGSFISIHKLKFTPDIFKKFFQHVIHGDSKLYELSQRQFPTDNTKSCFNEIKFSRNHELLAQDAINHHVINNHSDNQQYLLSQEMATARTGQPQVEPQSWSVGGHDSSQNQEGSNGHTLIESETWDTDNMKMLVDAMSISSIPSLTTSGEHDYAPYIDDNCYYGNDQQQQFASGNGHMGIEQPQLWSVEGMEFPGHDGSNVLNQFAQFVNRGDHPTHIDTPNIGISSNFDHHGQQLDPLPSLFPADYPLPLMAATPATQRSGLLPNIQEPLNYNYGNNWGWTSDFISEPLNYNYGNNWG